MSAYLSARESAAYCGVSEKTIRNWIASGRLSAEKSAGSFRIDQEALDALRSERLHPPQGAESASAELRADVGPQGAEGSAVVAGLAGLVALVDRLTAENRQLAESAAMWQERARILDERLALAPPEASHTQQESRQAPDPPTPITDAPAPLTPRLRALAPWLLVVLVVVLLAAGGWVVWLAPR